MHRPWYIDFKHDPLLLSMIEFTKNVIFANRAVLDPQVYWELRHFALLASCCEGYQRWLARTASADEYAPFGVELSSDGHFHLLSCPSVATDEATGGEADAAAEGGPCSKLHPHDCFVEEVKNLC